MKRIGVPSSVGLVLLMTLVPSSALAQRARGMGAPSAVHHHGGAGSGAHGASFHHHAFGARGPIVVLVPPVWYDPGVHYPSAAYDPSTAYGPAVYAPAGGSIALSSPPPMPSVIEYPTGRFELRGDGTTVPYRWVWIPNPPAAPPAPAPPSAPPAPPSAAPSSRDHDMPGHTTVYRWTDAQGVLHLTDRLDQVPEKYRSQASRPRAS